MDAASLPIDVLAERCARQTQLFVRRQPHDTRYCFEIIRRALTDTTSEAFTYVYRSYEPLVRQWVRNHSSFPATGEDADFFVQQAITNFYFALRGDKFHGFDALAAVLKYLKMCVHSAIVEYLRSQNRTVPIQEEHLGLPEPFNRLNSHMHALEIWDRIAQLLPDERDVRLVYYSFSLWLKPQEIAEAYPDEWSDARTVTVALYRIRQILRRDPQLQQLLDVQEVH